MNDFFGCELLLPQENPSSSSPSCSTTSTSALPQLSNQVFLWSIEDVHYWLKSIGFTEFLKPFENINGDLLLRLTPEKIKEDVDEEARKKRKRLWEELKNLKLLADYTPIDHTDLNGFLKNINPELCVYTYRILRNDLTQSMLAKMSKNELIKSCGIEDMVHLSQLMNALKTLAVSEKKKEASFETTENASGALFKLPQQFSYELPSQIFLPQPPPPYKLPQKVPAWNCTDVSFWLKRIGFETYIENFLTHAVDGDLLLQLKDSELKDDLGMTSGLHRKRFFRELDTLKVCADYSEIDVTNLEKQLEAVSPELSIYTYQMLAKGIDSKVLSSLTYEMMTACGITNPVHRLKLAKSYNIPEPSRNIPKEVIRPAVQQQIPHTECDVYISYRNSPGAELASLIKVLLQLRGYRVRMDIDNVVSKDRMSTLFRYIQSAKHFILVLTPNSLEPIINRPLQVHNELLCAHTNGKTIITVNHKDFKYTEDWHDLDVLKTAFSVNWAHDYQDACMQKIIRCFSAEK